MKMTESHVGVRQKGGRLALRWVVLGITCLVLVLNYADRAALGVAGPAMIRSFGFSPTEFGLISSFFFLGYAPFCFIGGWFSDKYGPRVVMGAAVGWWSIMTALTAAGAGFVSLLFIRLLFGFGEGPQGTLTVKTMRNWFPQRQMGTAVGLGQGATPLGGAIGTPLVAWLIASSGYWRVPFIVLGVLGVLVTIGWWVIVRDTPDVHPWATPEDAAAIRAGAITQRDDEGEAAAPLRYYMTRPLVLATATAFFGYGWVLFTFLSWFPIYLVQAHGLQLKQVAFTGTIPWLLGCVGFVLGGMVTDRVAVITGRPPMARKAMIIVGLTGTAICLGCIGLVTSLAAAVTLMSVIVFLLYLTGSQYFTLISDSVPSVRVGSVMGFVHTLSNLSGILAPFLVGLIIDMTHSWALAFGLSGAICLAGVLALAIWGRVEEVPLHPLSVQTAN
jgi:MFS transporter, ACS family, hexuronate transporter